jgi:hypothetical protein
MDCAAKLRNEELATMVKHCVETFRNRLTGDIQLIEQGPISVLE